ncbi:MAG TPA: TAXI family TRAP transporter solute-binding subunit, partial [Stellaceae bacterium]|nr:TAXI family TRAP transporter solute-binding subunit [Stellaceae bacterium]
MPGRRERRDREKPARTWRERLGVFGPAAILTLAALAITYQFVQPAPPRHITIATGSEQGAYFYYGQLYRDRLAAEGIDVTLQVTHGSPENIQMLQDGRADVAFIQGGTGADVDATHLRSVASLFFEPIWIFVRQGVKVTRLGDLTGRRVAIDREGSGTRAVALQLLADSGIKPDGLTALPLGGGDAARALRDGKIDAAFFVVAARAQMVHDLIGAANVRLFSIDRAPAYVVQHPFLSRLTLPEGAIDLAHDLPPADTTLLAPAANLVVRDNFHPALTELLLRIAKEVYGEPDLLQEAGQFPSRKYLEFRIADQARRYFDSGPSLLQRYLPFWVANLVDRLKIMLLPLITLVYPIFKLIPPAYDWRMRSRINRWYKELQDIELSLPAHSSAGDIRHRMAELDEIEQSLAHLEMPVSYGNALYSLRGHVALLRDELREAAKRQQDARAAAE